jgi:hypothetical protein
MTSILLLFLFIIVTLSILIAYKFIKQTHEIEMLTQNKTIPKVEFETNSSGKITDVAVVMVNVNDPRGVYSVPLWKHYCRVHGYDFIQLKDENTFDRKQLHPSWWKIPLCASVFSQGQYKYILHVDADTIPIRENLSVSSFINDVNDDICIWISKEPPQIKPRKSFGNINAGVFLIKNDEYTWNMLQSVWNDHEKTKVDWPWEQGSIENWIEKNYKNKEFKDKVYMLEYGIIQSFYMPEEGCDLMNLGVCSNPPWIAHVIKTIHPDWEDKYKKICTDRNIKRT